MGDCQIKLELLHIIGSVLLFIKEEYALSPFMLGLIAGAVIPGTMVGIFITTILADYWQRSRYITAAACVYLVSFFLLTFSHQITSFVIGRFLLGIANGVIILIVPLYLAEIASAKYRGAYVSLFQLSLTAGILLGYLVGYSLSYYQAWRWMFASGLIIAFLYLISSFYLPASAYFQKQIASEKKLSYDKKPIGRTLFIGCTLAILNQFTGINTVAYFAPQIFMEISHLSNSSSLFSSFILMTSNFIFTFISLVIFDWLGRYPVLIASFLIQCIALGMLSLSNFYHDPTIVMIALMIYIFGFAAGLGPGTFIIISEIYPLYFRRMGVGITVFINNLAAFIVITSFPYLLQLLGKSTIFLIFSMIAFFGLLFTIFFLPETKHKKLEEIDMSTK